MRFPDRITFGFKLIFTVALLVLAVTVLADNRNVLLTSPVLLFSSILIFLAALPWVLTPPIPMRALGLAGFVVGIFAVYVASLQLVGDVSYPRDCSNRFRLGIACPALNALYDFGGIEAVALFAFSIASLLFFVSFVLIRQRNG